MMVILTAKVIILVVTQAAFTCSKSAIETPAQCVKSVQS